MLRCPRIPPADLPEGLGVHPNEAGEELLASLVRDGVDTCP
ncbi:MAG: hypothetical protein U5R31_09520 [Acidimicrobiia bacterium]|nr:hypothetical protein [Acidimicrobiia bacterium]